MFITTSLQISFFPSEKAFSLRYQTAGMLETVLRQGVLGEDDTGEESPRSVLLYVVNTRGCSGRYSCVALHSGP